MKLLVKLLAISCGLLLVVGAAVIGWLYFFTADLPSTVFLSQYNPASPAEVRNSVKLLTHVVPSDQLGKYTLNAVVAAEGQPESRGPIHVVVANILSRTQAHDRSYSLQIARSLVTQGHTIYRQIDEIRLADQIQRRFRQAQLLTIYLNSVRMGENTYGVEDASVRYFGKHAASLTLDEAVLLAGLIRSPNVDSPINHPERAVKRRNWVIEQMVSQGSASSGDAEQAKAAPLIVKQTADSSPAYDWNRCTMKIINHKAPANGAIHMRTGERFTQTPVISFEVLESGEIRNAIFQRRSGVTDIDNYALDSVRSMKYAKRPAGCGIVASQAVVNVDVQ